MTAALLLLLAAPPLFAQEWAWETPPDEVLIGKPVTLKARVPGVLGEPSLEPGQPSETCAVLRAEAGPDSTLQITVSLFALGRQTIPALKWSAGGKAFTSPPLGITVHPPPPGPSDSGDIREIRGPYAARMGVWWGLLALLAAAAAYALWRLRKKREEPEAGETKAAPDTRTPEERALDALDALDGQALPVKEFYDKVSDIVRVYIHERHGLDAMTMTTYDLQRAMIRAGFAPEARQFAKALFDRCDLAKFAKMKPTDLEGRKDLETAKAVIKRLAPATGVDGDLAGMPRTGTRR